MSATSELRNSKSRVRLFFERTFPNVDAFKSAYRKQLNDVSTLLPVDPGKQYPWDLVGHAIDYRIRLFYRRYSVQSTFAANWRANPFYDDETTWIEFAWNRLNSLFDSATSAIEGQLLSREKEGQLARYCLFLSRLEATARSGRLYDGLAVRDALDKHKSVIISSDITLDEVLSNTPQNIVDDVISLYRGFFESQPPSQGVVILNPTFDGSNDIGGADGDIIVNEVIWDFKTSQDPRSYRIKLWLYQLLCYAMLDYSNQYNLSSCGFYLVRQRKWISWAFEEIFELCCANGNKNINAYRKQLRGILNPQWKAAQTRKRNLLKKKRLKRKRKSA